MSIERRKFSRVVFSTKDPRSSFLSEKAMAWTRKSRVPISFSRVAKAASIEASLVTSQGTKVLTPMDSPKGRTRFSMASR